MLKFVNLTLSGVSLGMTYAAVALALVMIWRATRIVNFAQGGMLMVTTFIAWDLVNRGHGYWVAFSAALLAGLVLGAVVERVLIRPVEQGPPINAVIVTLGLLILLQAVAGMIWGNSPRSFPAAFSIRGFRVAGSQLIFSPADTFRVVAVATVCLLLVVLFQFTNVGLRMRAAAFSPEVSRMLGVRVGRTLSLGWALAAVVGSLAGILIAPDVFVGPNQFDPILVFGFTASAIGGLDSPSGAIVGGLMLGCALSYVSGYLGSDIATLGALIILIAVLMVRPNGIFAQHTERRV